jgi:hypothetical protein
VYSTAAVILLFIVSSCKPSSPQQDRIILPEIGAKPALIPKDDDAEQICAPTNHSSKSEVSSLAICYIFVMVSGPQYGGMPTRRDVIYLGRDGLLQISRERTDDVILRLGESRVEPTGLLERAAAAEPLPSPIPPSQGGENIIVLPEYTGETLLIEMGLCSGSNRRWAGGMDSVPKALLDIVEGAQGLGRQVQQDTGGFEEGYIRAQLLAPDKVDQLQRADLIVEMSDQLLDDNPGLEEAISHPRRLVSIPSGAFPHNAGHLLTAGVRSLHVSDGANVWQVRNLIPAGE